MLGSMFGSGFKKTITALAAKNNWMIDDIGDEHAELVFEIDGVDQILEIFLHDDNETLEFTASLQGGYDNEEDMPHEVSTMLLRRNWELEIGQWCIDEDGGQLYWTCAYNLSIKELQPEYFAQIVAALVQEAAEVEAMTAQGDDDKSD